MENMKKIKKIEEIKKKKKKIKIILRSPQSTGSQNPNITPFTVVVSYHMVSVKQTKSPVS